CIRSLTSIHSTSAVCRYGLPAAHSTSQHRARNQSGSLNNGQTYPILLEIPGQGKSPDRHVDSNKTITHAEELQ
ncbi:MAG: hypothetical protein O6765_07175, partial [Gammaproteobacteria bacterium]|nr:hypothetical protein [Gammaproteobacteria bacterium]